LSNKSGAVHLQGKRGTQEIDGWLYFRDGRIIGARLGSLPPLEAAYTFFTLTSGPFRFHEDVLLDKPTITQSNNMIIMEGIMRQEALAHAPEPTLSSTTILRLVPNPASTGSEISLEADEWRVLTMVNGKNTVGYIAQRSGLGEARTCEILNRLLESGLVEKRDSNLTDSLFPELWRRSVLLPARCWSKRMCAPASTTRIRQRRNRSRLPSASLRHRRCARLAKRAFVSLLRK
jgi:hypothetical protein